MSRCLGVSLLLAAMVLAVGCGGGSSKSSPPPSSPSNPTPAITSISPASVIAGSAATPVTVTGTGFVSGSVAQWNGTALSTTYVSSTQLTATVPATNLVNGTLADITVSSPAPGGGLSAKASFTVNNPVPVVMGFSPGNFQAGDPDSVLTLSGTGFVPSSMVAWNGTALATTFVSGTQVAVTVPSSALASGQVSTVSVSNPTPAGGASPAANFNVNSPTPIISDFSPRTLKAGAAAVVKIMGSGFEANSIVRWNGADRTTTFVSSTVLQVQLLASDVQSYGTGQLSVYNPGPNGGSTTPVQLLVTSTAPSITSVYSSTPFIVNTGATSSAQLLIYGVNFASNATATANGTTLVIDNQSSTVITAELPASFFHQSGTVSIVVSNPGQPSVQTDPYTISIDKQHITPYLSKSGVPVGSSDTQITITSLPWPIPSDVVVTWNGTPLTTQVTSYSVTATIPASYLQRFVNASISVTASEYQSSVVDSVPFSTYLPLTVNDLKYNSTDGLLYATTPGSVGSLGNSVVAIDPYTGVIAKSIAVGSEPNHLALSDDGKKMFVGLDGAGALRQIDLTTGAPGTQISLGGGTSYYVYPYTASSLAVLPGQPNSVAVSSSAGVITIYDSGTARTVTSNGQGNIVSGALAFGSSASTLYVESNGLAALTLNSSGVASSATLNTDSQNVSSIQYDNGNIYLSNGIVLNAANGNQQGEFLVNGVNSPSTLVSDSSLYRAWGATVDSSNSSFGKIVAFDAVTYNPIGSISVGAVDSSSGNYPYGPRHLVRWGQNGLAFHTGSQVYVLQSSLVQDQSASPADVTVSLQAPTSATTGASFSYTVTMTNNGPNTAFGVNNIISIPSGIILGAITPSQGTCSGSGPIYCDLGSLANGASASVQITVTATTAGTLAASVNVATSSYDPTSSNNQSASSTTVTGSLYSAVPTVTQVSPSMVKAGAQGFTLTVDGTGFDSTSTVYWNGQSLPTSFVGSGELSATVSSTLVASLGSAKVWVANSAQSSSTSNSAFLSIYQVLPVQSTAIAFEPFTQKLYAALPSGATTYSGNSVVAIDPSSGSIGTPIFVGSEPSVLGETDDGKYLYVGLSGAKSLGRVNLLTQALEATIPLQFTQYGSTTGVAAAGIATMPGTDNTLAIDTGNSGTAILDISGSTGTFRTKTGGSSYRNSPAFADATRLYLWDSSWGQLDRFIVTSSGLALIDNTTLRSIGNFALINGIAYGAQGGIANASSTPPVQMATLPLGSSYYSNGAVAADPAQGKEFLLTNCGSTTPSLQRYDLSSYTQDYRFALPMSSTYINNPTCDVVRYGQDGLAVRLYDSSNPSNAANQIFLFQGPLILPSELAANSVPTISTPTPVAAGGANFYLPVTGSGFLPGAVVLWNGHARTTTYMDPSDLKVAIPASDIATAQSVTLTVENPGSGPSGSVTLTVQ